MAAGHGLRAVAVHPVAILILLGGGAFGTSLGAPVVVAVVAAMLAADVLYKGKVFGWTGDAAADEDAGSGPS